MTSHSAALGRVLDEVVEPRALQVDRDAVFPRPAVEALGQAGLLGLVSATDVGGLGGGLHDAVDVVDRLARHCGSTAMVICMHYAATAVIESYASPDVRSAIASGEHLSTLAFSEAGSRSHFWAPVGSAAADEGAVRLDADKSWVTSAGEADSYVWSSKPVASPDPSTLWLLPSGAAGLKVAGPFDGLGMRGNASNPVQARGVVVAPDARLGDDGAGFAIMMSLVLPWFSLLNAAVSVGTMEALTTKTAAHVTGVGFTHQSRRLADLPTIRAYLARMRIATDQARALLVDGLDAVESEREDAQLRILEVKAASGEAATAVADLAMRVCGGAAFRKDVGVERHFRDARAATVMAPTTDMLYDFVGRALCGLPLFGEEQQ